MQSCPAVTVEESPTTYWFISVSGQAKAPTPILRALHDLGAAKLVNDTGRGVQAQFDCLKRRPAADVHHSTRVYFFIDQKPLCVPAGFVGRAVRTRATCGRTRRR